MEYPKRRFDLETYPERITMWKATSNGEVKYYDIKRCKLPETALRRAQKVFDGQITISALSVYAESKPLIIE